MTGQGWLTSHVVQMGSVVVVSTLLDRSVSSVPEDTTHTQPADVRTCGFTAQPLFCGFNAQALHICSHFIRRCFMDICDIHPHQPVMYG